MKIPVDPASFSPAIAELYKLWIRSLRFEVHGDSSLLTRNQQAGKRQIIALWHGEIFCVTGFGWTLDLDLVTFVSQSKDGEVIARVIERLGHTTVRGSSTRGGVKALLRAKRIMDRENRAGVFTVDGPRGPRHKIKDGILFLAQRTDADVIPIRAYPRHRHVFEKSWDRFVVPFPFTRCPVYLGEPFRVTREKLTPEVMASERERLEQCMLSLGPEPMND
ncbi:lysophospholipid acyltransferase family protein [Pseudodesulfovibrio tunisiensis]|uniref:lysophospholipid acyltransferase family protein n=1 Tax=Pseudodesulfovibrio tunisiensis TaxID=463192 RepID=UPI001FB27F64|nr:lysophospholipid acyltransferase family protein [Pseudodesulfovibrio tunisiensis]